MIVMPSNSSGWFFHSLARETGKLGHLHSPGSQRGPWPWFPFALDNGAFSCWNMTANIFDWVKWQRMEPQWRQLLFWATSQPQRPMWAIVPDVPGDRKGTLKAWPRYAEDVQRCGISLAIAVQDGMTSADVRNLDPKPAVICVGGTTDWKWATVEQWCLDFPRVHLLRCNAPTKLDWLESIGCESTDGTAWNRGDRTQTSGLEEWCRKRAKATTEPCWPHVSRARCPKQMTFA